MPTHPRTLIAVAALALLAGCASWQQTEDQVWRRFSGGTLENWVPAREAAREHWPFAYASMAAYQDADDRGPFEATPECPEPHAYLRDRGWVLWEELPLLRRRDPEGSPGDRMRRAHLRAEVWSHREERKVIVAFGGTVFSNIEDWKSNFRWFIPEPEDAYTVLTDTFVPEFVQSFRQRSEQAGESWLDSAEVIATGHSMGAGLSQRFAYSLAPYRNVPKVRNVYAFDTSPVSGKRSVPDFRDAARGLTIHRIYNRGEILALVRGTFQFFYPPPESDGQKWVDVRYAVGHSVKTLTLPGTIRAHSLPGLACFMKLQTEARGARS